MHPEFERLCCGAKYLLVYYTCVELLFLEIEYTDCTKLLLPLSTTRGSKIRWEIPTPQL